jgi:hypothetical protein
MLMMSLPDINRPDGTEDGMVASSVLLRWTGQVQPAAMPQPDLISVAVMSIVLFSCRPGYAQLYYSRIDCIR